MILCSERCIPICDFCVHCIHELFEEDGEMLKGAPIDCKIGKSECKDYGGTYYCEEFHCFQVQCDETNVL